MLKIVNKSTFWYFAPINFQSRFITRASFARSYYVEIAFAMLIFSTEILTTQCWSMLEYGILEGYVPVSSENSNREIFVVKEFVTREAIVRSCVNTLGTGGVSNFRLRDNPIYLISP